MQQFSSIVLGPTFYTRPNLHVLLNTVAKLVKSSEQNAPIAFIVVRFTQGPNSSRDFSCLAIDFPWVISDTIPAPRLMVEVVKKRFYQVASYALLRPPPCVATSSISRNLALGSLKVSNSSFSLRGEFGITHVASTKIMSCCGNLATSRGERRSWAGLIIDLKQRKERTVERNEDGLVKEYERGAMFA